MKIKLRSKNLFSAKYSFLESDIHNQSVGERLRKKSAVTSFLQSTRQTEAVETARNNARSRLTSYLERLDETIIATRRRVDSYHEIT